MYQTKQDSLAIQKECHIKYDTVGKSFIYILKEIFTIKEKIEVQKINLLPVVSYKKPFA